MGVLDAFTSMWSSARRTFGEGSPQGGAQFNSSKQLKQLQSHVESAAPAQRWQGGASNAYAAVNADHGKVFARLADLDRRLATEIDNSAEVVATGRRDLDAVRMWVMAAASSVPRTPEGEAMIVPIVRKGLSDLTALVERSNGQLNTIGGRIAGIGSEYQSLGNQKWGIRQGTGDVPQAPPLPFSGDPADPSDRFIGNPQFGQWETLSTSPTGPWPSPKPEYRPFPEETPLKVGPTTGLYVPQQTWIAHEDEPVAQFKEGYRFRMAGTDATSITRTVIDENGRPQLQRWIANVYEYQRNTSVAPAGDLVGLPPIQNIDHTWKPITLPEIATLSAGNAGITYYLPDGCGGTVNFVGGVLENPGPPQVPVMTRPR